MVITAGHLPHIVALIAGVLILIMPRLLNYIVAIYLIFVGLVGMGLLRWLHLSRESGVSRLARNPPKWCKARIFDPSFRIVV